jgi:hypothetical protein
MTSLDLDHRSFFSYNEHVAIYSPAIEQNARRQCAFSLTRSSLVDDGHRKLVAEIGMVR